MDNAPGASDEILESSSSESRINPHNNVLLDRIKACISGHEEVKASILSTGEDLQRRSQGIDPMRGERDTDKPTKRPLDASCTLSTATETATSNDTLSSEPSEENFEPKEEEVYSFFLFRMSYLIVTLVIMLADGLQGKSSPCQALVTASQSAY